MREHVEHGHVVSLKKSDQFRWRKKDRVEEVEQSTGEDDEDFVRTGFPNAFTDDCPNAVAEPNIRPEAKCSTTSGMRGGTQKRETQRADILKSARLLLEVGTVRMLHNDPAARQRIPEAAPQHSVISVMERMVPEPRTFKELVEADVRRAARLVLKVQDEIDPQFRIATPEGDCWILQ